MKKSFFYVEDEPELYDIAAPLTERTYELGHDALQLVLRQHLGSMEKNGSAVTKVLDLGCGTGKECLPLLSYCKVNLTAVDFSAPMLTQLAKKLEIAFGSTFCAAHTRLIECDFSNKNWISALDSAGRNNDDFNVVVAAHSLHHLSIIEKRNLYRQIYSLLSVDGVLAILDLFDYFDANISQLAQRNIVEWLSEQMSNESLAAAQAGLFPLERRVQLRESWIHHLEHENHPIPLLAVRRQKCDVGESEVDILFDAGFCKIEVPFRWFQSGLIFASKLA